MSVVDYANRPLSLDNILLNSRGRLYQITDTTVGSGYVHGRLLNKLLRPVGKEELIRAYHCFLVTTQEIEEYRSHTYNLTALWETLFRKYKIAERLKAEAATQRKPLTRKYEESS